MSEVPSSQGSSDRTLAELQAKWRDEQNGIRFSADVCGFARANQLVQCADALQPFIDRERSIREAIEDRDIFDKWWNDLKSAVLGAVPNLPDEFDWKDAEQLIKDGIEKYAINRERSQQHVEQKEHKP